MIHRYLPTNTYSYKYTISQDCLHIVRLFRSETDVDYTADCKYSFYGDTLVISNFILSAVATNPPHYVDLILIRPQK